MVLEAMSDSTDKSTLRKELLDRRNQADSRDLALLNSAICKNLSFVWAEGGNLPAQGGRINERPLWGAYKSFRHEADPNDAIVDATQFIRWTFPKILNENEMEFREQVTREPNWVKNSLGIWEPDIQSSEVVDLTQCTGILIPGVGFDRNGHRLGFGKGYYDKALTGFQGLKVGVAYSFQITEQPLPHDDQDVRMDLIVTDKEIIRALGSPN